MKKYLALAVLALISVAAYAQDAAELINQANEAMRNRQYPQAFEMYDKAMGNLGDVEVPNSIFFNIGFAAMQAEKNEEAIKYLDKAIEADVNVSKSWEYKATIYNKTSSFDKALEAFEKALETADENVGALSFNTAVVAFRLQNFEKTVKYFDKAYAEGFRPQDALVNKASALNRMQDNEAYKATLEEGYSKYPDEKRITSALANIYVAEGNAIYQGGAQILNAANQRVNSGAITTEDDAYKAELDKAKAEFKKAMEILTKATTVDASNANASRLIEAIKPLI